MRAVYRAIIEKLKAGEPVTLVTVVESKGSAPRHAGALMAVFEDGSAEGTVGGGAVENEAKKRAQELMDGAGEIRRYNLTRDDAAGLGMICGGDVTLLFNPLPKGSAKAVAIFEDILTARDERSPRWLAQELPEDGPVRMALYGKNKLELGRRDGAGAAARRNAGLRGRQAAALCRSGDPGRARAGFRRRARIPRAGANPEQHRLPGVRL